MDFYTKKFRFFVLFVVWFLCASGISGCSFSLIRDETPPAAARIANTGLLTQPPAQEPTPSTADAPPAGTESRSGRVTFSGAVINQSGGRVPAGLEITLQGYIEMENTLTLTTAAGSDGAYAFEPVEAADGQIFVITARYNGMVFPSGFIEYSTEDTADTVTVDLAVYDSTTSLEGALIDRVHIFVTALSREELQFVVYVLISNPTNRVIAAPEGQPLLTYSLPDGAQGLLVDDAGQEDRFVLAENSFGDTYGISPGQQSHEVLYSFVMPYDGSLDVAITFPLPGENGTIILPQGLKTEGSGLTDGGQREMSSGVVNLVNFSALDAGQPLALNITGRVRVGQNGLSSTAYLIIGAAAFVLALLAGLFWLRRKARTMRLAEQSAVKAVSESEERLLDAIIALDENLEKGLLNSAEHQRRRQELLVRLRALRKA